MLSLSFFGVFFFFFFKQKTAYELRISDWSSDVCSSDLGMRVRFNEVRRVGPQPDDGMARPLWRPWRHDLLACGEARDLRLFPAQAVLFLGGRLHDRRRATPLHRHGNPAPVRR